MQTPTAAALSSMYYPPTEQGSGLIGLPRLMELAFRGVDLGPTRDRLIGRLESAPRDAAALLDLACLMSIGGHAELAQRVQDEALAVSRRYTLEPPGGATLRVLTLMAPGTLMTNMPIEFLLHGSDAALEMVYLQPGPAPSWPELPPHDVACVGICESPAARPLLQALAQAMPRLPRPTLNHPLRVLQLARDTVWRVLQDIPDCLMAASAAVSRADLVRLAAGEVALGGLLAGAALPIICRPCGSHAGQGLCRIADPAELVDYLAANRDDDFVISSFIDYASPDRQYRKYRIAFVGGRAMPVHMALSARWMVHYLNGDMIDRPDNRAEEQRFLDGFDAGFGRRHAAALAQIDRRLGLDYYSIDCGETQDGRLLVFECDTGGVAHAMDPLEGFGYKRVHMLRLFAAFRSLLERAAADPGALKPAPQASWG